MTFAELQRGVFDDLQYQAAPKPGVQERTRRYLNEGLERVLRRPRLRQLRLTMLPQHTIAGAGFYGAPSAIERIDYVIDRATGLRLPMRSRDWYRSLHDPDALGTPQYWIPEGITPVLRQPRLGATTEPPETEIWVGAQAATDTTQTVRVRLTYFLGNEFTVPTQLQGTTYVPLALPLPGPAGPARISAISLDATADQYVFLTDRQPVASLRTDLVAVIPPGQLTPRHVGFRLYPAPATDGEESYEIEGQLVVPHLTRDEEEPPFPADFHEMLCCYARARFYRKDGRLQQSQLEMAEFERYALDLTAAVEYPVSYKPVAGKLSPGHHGWSDLGPWYPADRGGY